MSDSEVFRLFQAKRVLTMAGPDAEAFVTFGGRIVAVGNAGDLRAQFSTAEQVDLGDGIVLPGFNDAHMHPSKAAEYRVHVNLDPDKVTTPEALFEKLREEVARTPKGQWIQAVRYDHAKTTGGRIIDRGDLDRISTDHPIHVRHLSGHIGVANTPALALGGIGDHDEPPSGGEYGKGDDGRVNGVLYGRAENLFIVRLPEPDLEARLRGFSSALQDFHAAGITSITDAMVIPSAIELFQEADARGLLTARVGMLIRHDYFDRIRDLKIRSGFGSDKLRLIGVKGVLDGAVAGGTCFCEQPLEGTTYSGMLNMTAAELTDLVRAVHASGNCLAMHANGDRAIKMLLAEVSAAMAAAPRPGLHHRIEHCSLITPEIVAEIKALDLMVVPLMSYPAFHGEKIRQYFGARRADWMIACRSFLDAGITVGGSSDFGAGPFEPLRNIQGCVLRLDTSGQLVGPSQRILVEEALEIYTAGSAAVSGEAGIKGRIKPGQLADFTVIEQSPIEVEPHTIRRIPVRSTWVGAEKVWGSH